MTLPRKQGSLKLSTLCFLLGLLTMYKIDSISYFIHGFGAFYYLLSGVELFLSVIVYAMGEARWSMMHTLTLAYCVAILGSTVMNGASISACLQEIFTLFPFLVMMDLGIRCGGRRFYRAAFLISCPLLTLNTITAILFPHAMFRDVTGASTIFLLGADNSLVVRYMIGALFEWLYRREYRNDRQFPVCAIANLLVFVFVRDIGAGKVITVIMIVLLLLALKLPEFKFGLGLAVGINAAFFLIIVVGGGSLGWANPIFELLGRNSNLTHRTWLWSFALGLISAHPLLGIGSFTATSFNDLIFGMTTSGLYNTGNPHNTYLTVLLTGGLITFAVFCWLIGIACRNGRTLTDYRLSTILFIFLFAFMFHAQIEGRDTVYILAMSYCMYDISRLNVNTLKYCSGSSTAMSRSEQA